MLRLLSLSIYCISKTFISKTESQKSVKWCLSIKLLNKSYNKKLIFLTFTTNSSSRSRAVKTLNLIHILWEFFFTSWCILNIRSFLKEPCIFPLLQITRKLWKMPCFCFSIKVEICLIWKMSFRLVMISRIRSNKINRFWILALRRLEI